MTLDTTNWWWNPGDSIGVLPCNDEELVDTLLHRLHVDPNQPFAMPSKGQKLLSPLVYQRIAALPTQIFTVKEVLLKVNWQYLRLWFCFFENVGVSPRINFHC